MRARQLLGRAVVVALTAATLTTSMGATPASAVGGVAVRLVKGGLNGPAAFTFSPRGLIFYAERGTGEIRVLNPRTHTDRLVYTISGVNADGERGALGVALHPGWPQRPFIYVYATRNAGGALHNQIAPDPGQERPRRGRPDAVPDLRRDGPVSQRRPDPLRTGRKPVRHGGRRAHQLERAGPDGEPARQDLRMDPDGGVAGNPIPGSRIWSYGTGTPSASRSIRRPAGSGRPRTDPSVTTRSTWSGGTGTTPGVRTRTARGPAPATRTTAARRRGGDPSGSRKGRSASRATRSAIRAAWEAAMRATCSSAA